MSDENQFVEEWIRENINAEPYEEGQGRAREHADQCYLAAAEAGFSKADIDAEGDLVDRIAGAMEAATDNEVRRLVAKDA